MSFVESVYSLKISNSEISISILVYLTLKQKLIWFVVVLKTFCPYRSEHQSILLMTIEAGRMIVAFFIHSHHIVTVDAFCDCPIFTLMLFIARTPPTNKWTTVVSFVETISIMSQNCSVSNGGVLGERFKNWKIITKYTFD